MATGFSATHRVIPAKGTDLDRSRHSLAAITATIAGAWGLAASIQLSGHASILHHHTLIEHGPALWIAIPFALLGWQVMIAAMMLPASLPNIRAFNVGADLLPHPHRALAAFLGTYALVWTAFGLAAFMGDFVLHHIVDASPWLATHPWLIESGVVGFAGAFQLSAFKRGSLTRCRHPTSTAVSTAMQERSSLELGFQHAIDCLGSSGALMLLMFAEGFANLWWMAALTGVMVYETTGRHGERVAQAAGLLLLVFAAVIFFSRGAV